MTINFGTVLIGAALAASIYLLLNKSDRMFPTIAVVAAGIELLLVTGVLSMSLARFRIDVILPALLAVAGGMSWVRSSEKGLITAATGVTLIGAIQLMLALRLG